MLHGSHSVSFASRTFRLFAAALAASTLAQVRFTGGPLPDNQFDEFALSVTLPDLKTPAALLEVQPAEHAHHAH
jgi:hypothetical protein